MKQQEVQMQAQIDAQKMQMKAQLEMQMEQMRHEMTKEIELIRAQAVLGRSVTEKEFKEKIEILKEDRKDERVKKQSAEQSKLISQRKGERGELQEPTSESSMKEKTPEEIVNEIIRNGNS
jgi:hypothetical protein